MKRRGLIRTTRTSKISSGYGIEQLEQRQLLAWQPLGPFGATNGQVENINPDEDVVGAVQTVLADPSDADVLYIGAVNGGVWKTDNATAERPDWTPLTDGQASSSIGAMTFDAADSSNQTIYAGIGHYSSYGRTGNDRIGLLHTTDGGSTWDVIDGGGTLVGKNISGIQVNGSNIVVSVNTDDSFSYSNTGIFRSTDGGATFTQVSTGDGTATGLPAGISYDLVADPTDPTILYTAMVQTAVAGGGNVGVYRSSDGGANWTKVSSAAMDALIDDGTNFTGTNNLEMAVGQSNNVYVGIINYGQLAGIFRSGDGGTTWTQMDTPETNEGGTLVGINPEDDQELIDENPTLEDLAGSQGGIHFSIVADPNNANIVYVGGDRQPLEYQNPTSVGATDYSGRLFRGDASQATGSQWVHLTHSNSLGPAGGGTASSSAPHADSREMTFDADGNIIETDDGGIYRRTQPQSDQGDWFSVIGNLQITEVHDVAYDSVSNLAITGNQDTGTTQQVPNQSLWYSVTTGDGGDVAVDDVSLAAQGESIRYSSYYSLGLFARRTYDSSGNLVLEEYPALNLNSGTPFVGAFRTPVAINTVNPSKLIFQGDSGLYESADQGDSIDEVTVSGGGSAANGGLEQNAIVAGGYSGGTAQENVLWVGADDNVFLRDETGTQLVATTSPGLGTIRGLTVDPAEWKSVFVVDGSSVAMSSDAGSSWQDVTGDLMSYATSIWSITYVPGSVVDSLVVGTNAGVFVSYVDSLGTWSPLSTGMPNTIVDTMEYDPTANVLVAGTLGRGAWILNNASQTVQNNNQQVVQTLGACEIEFPISTVSFAGAVGGNIFASNHAILDGGEPGQLGMDDAVLDYLRGVGTNEEIAKSDYSIAVIGNGLTDWSFSNGTKFASGYKKTDYYNIDYMTPTDLTNALDHNLVIVLSGEGAVTGGMTTDEMASWATAEPLLVDAVNLKGLDIWVGASGGDSSYFDFLPANTLSSADFTTPDPVYGFAETPEGSAIGITSAMVNAGAATQYYDSFDSDLYSFEIRNTGETISVGAQGIAFENDELVPASSVTGGETQGLIGTAYEDLNVNGIQDLNEQGVAGARFFIDYNGDGIIGLCEPTATSDALGRFQLHSGYSGTFRILPVPTAGFVPTTTEPIYVTINTDGTATLSSELSFGVITGSDTGNGLGGSVPIADGAFLGASPVKDDGVFFGNGIVKGKNTVTITSSVTHSNTVMNAWIDLNKDGDFNDANEHIFTNVVLTYGKHDYTFNIPSYVFDDSSLPDAARLAANIRFRVGPTLNVGPTADDLFGEIEDYKVYISQDPQAGLVANDDAFEYQEDTAGQVFDVLANDVSYFDRTLSIVPGSVANVSPTLPDTASITVSPDGTRILFDATGVTGLGDITFTYQVQDTDGNVQTATVTLVPPLDPNASPALAPNTTFVNPNGNRADVNNDGVVDGHDLLALIVQVNSIGPRNLPNLQSVSSGFNSYVDVNGDGRFSTADFLKFLDLFAGETDTPSVAGESIQSDPIPLTSSSIVASPLVSVVAPITSTDSSNTATSASPATYVGPQPFFVDSSQKDKSQSDSSTQVPTSDVFDPLATDQTLAAFSEDQADLLWAMDDDISTSSSDSADASDDLFASDEFEMELIGS